jgi:hypothetical protein
MEKLNERDLENLIDEKLKKCDGYQNICYLAATQEGRTRLKTRIKQIIFHDGITSIDAVLVQLETELRFS